MFPRVLRRPIYIAFSTYALANMGMLGGAYVVPADCVSAPGQPRFQAFHRDHWWSGLRSTEQHSLEAVVAVMSMKGYPRGLSSNPFHPAAIWEDTMFQLHTEGEIADGWSFLASLFTCAYVRVDPTSLARHQNSLQAVVTFAYYPNFIPQRLWNPMVSFPLLVTVERCAENNTKSHLVTAVRVQWFKGVLFTQGIVPMQGAWGDVLRRINGVILSSLVRSGTTISDSVTKFF